MINLNEILHRLVADYSELGEVVGLTMAGSKAASLQDDLSDINLDVYLVNPLTEEKRRQIILKYATKIEMNYPSFVTGDHFLLSDFPVEITVSFIILSELEQELYDVMERHVAKVGYTTCFIRNFMDSTILFDKGGRLKALYEKYATTYPKQLKENIIDLNFPLLKDSFSSYYHQLEQAIIRQDTLSIPPRVSKFLASYFDIIFAINEVYHPGEKRLIQIMEDSCDIYPTNLNEKVKQLMGYAAQGDIQFLDIMDEMIRGLEEVLNEQNTAS
ncbi:MAG: DUF4037 domain-containing protein [Turicibacter sanguinis]|uniref:DUF4037 domain-containing protein n=1 Tax=Turicibacter sanguinis TaxID=154288 RepID=UPI002F958BEA